MLFKPAQLGLAKLGAAELEADKKACKKIGPCGVGKKALYLNSFYIDRCYYLPYGSITRAFKRVAMSQGGFTGKGMFASMAYLVVEYDGGKQKQCNFKDERDVDALLDVLAKEQPQIIALRPLRAGFTRVALWSLRAGFAGIAFRPLRAGFAGSAVLAVFSVLTVGAVFAIPAVKQPGIGIGPEGICHRNGGFRLGKQALDEGGGGFSGGIFLRLGAGAYGP